MTTKERTEKKKEMKALYKVVFGSEQGRLVLEDIRREFGHGQSVFTDDPHVNAFRQGYQCGGVYINNMIKDKGKT